MASPNGGVQGSLQKNWVIIVWIIGSIAAGVAFKGMTEQTLAQHQKVLDRIEERVRIMENSSARIEEKMDSLKERISLFHRQSSRKLSQD